MYLPKIIQKMKTKVQFKPDKQGPQVVELPHHFRDGLVYAMTKDFEITDGAEFIDDGVRMKEQPLDKPSMTPSLHMGAVDPFDPLRAAQHLKIVKPLAPTRIKLKPIEKPHLTPEVVIKVLQQEG